MLTHKARPEEAMAEPLPTDSGPNDEPRTGHRLIFIDVLRVVLIMLVIAHHAGQA